MQCERCESLNATRFLGELAVTALCPECIEKSKKDPRPWRLSGLIPRGICLECGDEIESVAIRCARCAFKAAEAAIKHGWREA